MASSSKATRPKPRRLTKGEADTLKLCIAGAWLHGTISRGRAAEMARALGWEPEEIENLKYLEECAEEAEREREREDVVT